MHAFAILNRRQPSQEVLQSLGGSLVLIQIHKKHVMYINVLHAYAHACMQMCTYSICATCLDVGRSTRAQYVPHVTCKLSSLARKATHKCSSPHSVSMDIACFRCSNPRDVFEHDVHFLHLLFEALHCLWFHMLGCKHVGGLNARLLSNKTFDFK